MLLIIIAPPSHHFIIDDAWSLKVIAACISRLSSQTLPHDLYTLYEKYILVLMTVSWKVVGLLRFQIFLTYYTLQQGEGNCA